MKRYTEDQVVDRLRGILNRASVRSLASDLGVSPSYIQKVCAGELRPGAKLLRAMGLRRIVLYEREGL